MFLLEMLPELSDEYFIAEKIFGSHVCLTARCAFLDLVVFKSGGAQYRGMGSSGDFADFGFIDLHGFRLALWRFSGKDQGLLGDFFEEIVFVGGF